MTKFKVRAKSVTYYTVEVEAESQHDAIEKAKDIDGGDFTCEDKYGGSWNIIEAERIRQ